MYSVPLGNSITPLTTGIRLEVKATNNLGGEITNSQIYSVDRYAPVITFQYPENASQVTLVNESSKINIRATYTDMVLSKNAKQERNTSGIASAVLVVTYNNNIVLQKTTGADTTEVEASLDHLSIGIYTIRLTVWDKAGNRAVETITCEVIAAPIPPVALSITDAHMTPNPITDDGRTATLRVLVSGNAKVDATVYDFAGREVRKLTSNTVKDGNVVTFSWNGRSTNGDKLARGTYFIRVIANDGKKIVEKVVKVAITK